MHSLYPQSVMIAQIHHKLSLTPASVKLRLTADLFIICADTVGRFQSFSIFKS